ncbi:gustatory receptor for sugar taste 43a [Drosophila sulfurigaster albostrigata]|uniref:Gustatory receptor n=1 Tax=Drosophila albomicans TaxID=7291 RepID=A0A6P8WVD0_DROAB|nr:gustatory receptor for sugar taste 43a isoform X2 [Drosophila albomicans]XP_062130709.1 gustatory receptor for sugar taste 43a [Drosophila sulfurigaster albostrigata]
MEISEPSIGIFYVSKLLALAPYSAQKNSKGQLEIRRSWIFTIYSASLCVILVFLTYRGLLFDANSKIPVRMKSATSKVVTASDVSVVVLAIVAGVYCGLFGLRATQELNMRLHRIDSTLSAYNNYRRDRWRAFGMASISLIVIGILLGLDVWTWVRMAQQMNINKSDTELNVQWYIPFYSLYFILTGLHIHFANTAYGLGRRYGRLNLMLRTSYLGDKSYTSASNLVKVNTVRTINFNPMMPTALHASLTKLNGEMLANESAAKNKSLVIRAMADNHESLGKCVRLLSSSYGIAVLFILVSCLLHLVATAYFLFLEMLNKRDNGYVWVQMLWIIFHFLRLLMVVEPCHLAARESRKTIQIVCEIERKVYEPILAEEAKKFWQQLLVVDADFSASGLCRVNRTILTSFASAIATYLVILIQFQKTNG